MYHDLMSDNPIILTRVDCSWRYPKVATVEISHPPYAMYPCTVFCDPDYSPDRMWGCCLGTYKYRERGGKTIYEPTVLIPNPSDRKVFEGFVAARMGEALEVDPYDADELKRLWCQYGDLWYRYKYKTKKKLPNWYKELINKHEQEFN